ncbi:hypothetical protein [Ruminococcus sp.]
MRFLGGAAKSIFAHLTKQSGCDRIILQYDIVANYYQQKASGAATLGAFALSVNKANEVGIFVGLRSIFKSISAHLTIVAAYAIIIYIEII